MQRSHWLRQVPKARGIGQIKLRAGVVRDDPRKHLQARRDGTEGGGGVSYCVMPQSAVCAPRTAQRTAQHCSGSAPRAAVAAHRVLRQVNVRPAGERVEVHQVLQRRHVAPLPPRRHSRYRLLRHLPPAARRRPTPPAAARRRAGATRGRRGGGGRRGAGKRDGTGRDGMGWEGTGAMRR